MKIARVGLRVRVVTFLFLLASACGGPEARAPHVERPVDERRASEVIARVFANSNLDPELNREVRVSGRRLILEVAATGHKFGVAYLTREEAAALADVLPKRAPDSDALIVLPGEAGAEVLFLFERDYLQDDLMGEAHTNTNIAAEMKLERDVKDFLRKAREEQWP